MVGIWVVPCGRARQAVWSGTAARAVGHGGLVVGHGRPYGRARRPVRSGTAARPY
ncbi:MAG: hypothetical protein H6637_07935 [Ardenticatenales bacterium]|nr:hypothetical protein [Ardenticatenales bacterium]